VVLATDGDFNVGTTGEGDLVRLIERERKSGVFLSVLGFGMGNLKDSTMEKLADKGDGNYAYIDSPREAARVAFSAGTLLTVARDVKIQVEFNPAQVSAYRLIGYENRLLEDEDFNNDAKDAGELGAGQIVTALYELVPAGSTAPASRRGVDALKYQTERAPSAAAASGDLFTVKVRYKPAQGGKSRLVTQAVRGGGAEASPALRFTASVAAFGMLLRGSPHRGSATWNQVREWADVRDLPDPMGLRAEFLGLVGKAESLEADRLADATPGE